MLVHSTKNGTWYQIMHYLDLPNESAAARHDAQKYAKQTGTTRMYSTRRETRERFTSRCSTFDDLDRFVRDTVPGSADEATFEHLIDYTRQEGCDCVVMHANGVSRG